MSRTALARPRPSKWIMTVGDLDTIANRSDHKCIYCGAGKRTGWSVDHFIARAAGGEHVIDNCVWCCTFCNGSKGTRSLKDFRHYCALHVLKWPKGLTKDYIRWAARRGADISKYRDFRFWFEEDQSTAANETKSHLKSYIQQHFDNGARFPGWELSEIKDLKEAA